MREKERGTLVAERGKLEGIEEEVEREGRREGGLSQVGGSRIEHASTHTLHPPGTRPLFMLDIIPLSKHTHFSRSLNVCSRAHVGERAGPHDTRGSYSRVYRFSVSMVQQYCFLRDRVASLRQTERRPTHRRPDQVCN